MPVLREAGFKADDTDGSILKAIAKRGLDEDQVEYAARGLGLMRDAGELVDVLGVSRGDKLNLRILYAQEGPRAGPQPLWNVAVQRYVADLERREKRDRRGMRSVGEVMRGGP